MNVQIPLELYDNNSNDSEYQELIRQMQKLVNKRKKCEYIDLLKRICYSYMFSRKAWVAIFQFIENTDAFWNDIHYFERQSMFQFFYPTENDNLFYGLCQGFYPPKLLFIKRDYTIRKWSKQLKEQGMLGINSDLLVNDLKFPHCDLDDFFSWYEKNLCSLPPKKVIETYQKSKQFYKNLIQMNEESDEWFAEVLKVDDVEFIEHNFEYKLSTNPLNQELWEKYLKFLEQNNIQKMLFTYSKYCRVFPSNMEIRERYQNVVKEHASNVLAIPWYNPFDFEKCEKTFFDEETNENDKPEPVHHHSSCIIHYTSKNSKLQQFVFRNSLMHYILKNSSANVYLKLASSCKYFYSKLPLLICYKINVMDYNYKQTKICQFCQQSLLLNHYDVHEITLQNIYVTTVLNIQSENRNFLSKLIQRITKCTVKYLKIVEQDLTLDELKFLTYEGNVEELILEDVKIINSNGNNVYLEDILSMVPKLKKYVGLNFLTSTQTLLKLMEIPFENKIKSMNLSGTDIDHFDSHKFVEFLKKNVDYDGDISIRFPEEFEDQEKTHEFRDNVLHELETSWIGFHKPLFALFFS